MQARNLTGAQPPFCNQYRRAFESHSKALIRESSPLLHCSIAPCSIITGTSHQPSSFQNVQFQSTRSNRFSTFHASSSFSESVQSSGQFLTRSNYWQMFLSFGTRLVHVQIPPRPHPAQRRCSVSDFAATFGRIWKFPRLFSYIILKEGKAKAGRGGGGRGVVVAVERGEREGGVELLVQVTCLSTVGVISLGFQTGQHGCPYAAARRQHHRSAQRPRVSNWRYYY